MLVRGLSLFVPVETCKQKVSGYNYGATFCLVILLPLSIYFRARSKTKLI